MGSETPEPILVPYEPAWPERFAQLRAVYATALEGLFVSIEHVGSTAVPGLLAKPILDIDIVIPTRAALPEVAARLATLGYRHNGDQGIPEREVFKANESTAPYTEPRQIWMSHHLYVCHAESAELRRHVQFRDALRRFPDVRAEYERLKRETALAAQGDRKVYAHLKENTCRAFIEGVLQTSLMVLVPATDADFEALVSLRIAAMRESLERIGRFEPARARERFRASFAREWTRHIEWEGQRVGFVAVKPDGDALLLDHLYIAPKFQGKGLGSAVLALVFAEADAAGKTLRVGALRESASNAFYQRHGFVKTDEAEWDIYYERRHTRT
jgi:GrpB-like predicted nucleotidyltransferase (UPF0157 family)/GNAT superfamily N-acetyltransferase